MKQPRGINLRRVIIIAAVALLFGIVLLFWARDVIREVVVLPLSYLFWFFGLFIKSTPQLFFWISLLLVSFMIAYRSLAGKKRARADYTYGMGIDEAPDRHLVTGRVVYWRAKENLLRAGSGSYYQTTFHAAITRLLLDQLSHRYCLPTGEVEKRLREQTIDVPDEVRAYVLCSLTRSEQVSAGFFALFWRTFMERVRAWMDRWRKAPEDHPVDPQFARILQYMEEELEVSHDHPGQ